MLLAVTDAVSDALLLGLGVGVVDGEVLGDEEADTLPLGDTDDVDDGLLPAEILLVALGETLLVWLGLLDGVDDELTDAE